MVGEVAICWIFERERAYYEWDDIVPGIFDLFNTSCLEASNSEYFTSRSRLFILWDSCLGSARLCSVLAIDGFLYPQLCLERFLE
jgi:hypothetical protein